MKEYLEIKKNFIENFFNKNFRYSVVSVKKALVDKMEYAFPFKFVIYDNDVTKVSLDLGDNVIINFNLIWTEVRHQNGHVLYRLSKID